VSEERRARGPGCFVLAPDVLPYVRRAVSQVVHERGCTRAPCRCFGITARVAEAGELVLVLRLLMAGEVVGSVRLLVLGGMLLMGGAAVFRAEPVGDWARHHLVVSEMLLRESARVADERRMVLATAVREPRAVLQELGFTPVGSLMRREARRLAVGVLGPEAVQVADDAGVGGVGGEAGECAAGGFA
jgi:hypothetical protein